MKIGNLPHCRCANTAIFVPPERVELSEQQILNLSAMPIRVQRLKEQIHYYWLTAQQKATKAAIPEILRIFIVSGDLLFWITLRSWEGTILQPID